MKKILLFCFVICCLSCQKDKNQQKNQKQTEETAEKKTLNILEKVAYTYGYERWSDVKQVDFSFVVNPGEEEMLRKWSWFPQSQKVTLIKGNEMITYYRPDMMDEFKKTDKAFVNDSFWLLFPFHLLWSDVAFKTKDNVISPIHKERTTKLIVEYPKEGGYTPGDRYEVYLDDKYYIKEWSYHPSGKVEAALINTFEDLSDFSGIKVNMQHRNPNSDFQLNFRDVEFSFN
jgi:hypothetical protein